MTTQSPPLPGPSGPVPERVAAVSRRLRASTIVNAIGLSLVALFLVWLAINAVKAPTDFFNVLWIGITLGALYGLVSLGYTLVYGILELINFAHGDVFMLCGMFAVTLVSAFALQGVEAGDSWGKVWGVIIVMLLLAMVFGALVNVATERIAYRRLRGAPRLIPLITAIGMSFILQNLGLAWKGASQIGIPDLLPEGDVFRIGDVALGWDKVFVWIVTLPVLLALIFLVQRTKPGKAMRAVAQDMDAAAMMGISVNRTVAFTFAVAGALAGAAGVLYVLYSQTIRFDTGFQLGLIAFTAAVLGGIGNLTGALLGSMVIGLVQAFNEGLSWYAPGSDWTQSLVFAILILILIFRPEGILGEKPPEGQ